MTLSANQTYIIHACVNTELGGFNLTLCHAWTGHPSNYLGVSILHFKVPEEQDKGQKEFDQGFERRNNSQG